MLASLEQGKQMKCKRIFSMSVALVLFGLLAVNSGQAAWTITQLTDSSYTLYHAADPKGRSP